MGRAGGGYLPVAAVSAAEDLALCERLLPGVRGELPLNTGSTVKPRAFLAWLAVYKCNQWQGWQRECADSILHGVAEALRRREKGEHGDVSAQFAAD